MTVLRAALEHRSLGSIYLSRGLFVAARDEFARWLHQTELTADVVQIIPALNALTVVALEQSDPNVALVWVTRAAELAQGSGVPASDRFRVALNQMAVFTNLGELEKALEASEHALSLDPEQEIELSQRYWLNLSFLHWRRLNWLAMRHAANRAVRGSEAVHNPTARVRGLLNRGIAHLELGAYRAAERDLNEALRHARQYQSPDIAYAHAEIGRLHFLRGHREAALEAGRDALAALFTHGAGLDKSEVAHVSWLFGVIFAEMGQRNVALKYLNRAAAYFSQLGLYTEWQRSLERISRLLTEQRRPSPGFESVQRLDFLTAVLDLTDDLESVDSYLRGQSERVAVLSTILGAELGLSNDELFILNYAARLHDVGMVAVDVELLHKTGPLTESEMRRVAMHTVIGEEMVRPHGLAEAGLRAIRHHHERFDGSGGPDGLTGEQIPMFARILSVTDAYDALTSDRAYRPALTHEEALAELRAMAGSSLDPDLVVRFLRLYNSK